MVTFYSYTIAGGVAACADTVITDHLFKMISDRYH